MNIYEKMGQSNREIEKKAFSISSFTPSENNELRTYLKRNDGQSFEKQADEKENPFDAFSKAKHLIISKFGVAEELAHDLATSTVVKAEELQERFGGSYEDVISGIIDNMDHGEIKRRIGGIPMRPESSKDMQDALKVKLMKELHMSSFQADRVKMTILQQAKNMYMTHRQYSTSELADAILNVAIEYRDPSIIYGLSSNDRLKSEVEQHLH